MKKDHNDFQILKTIEADSSVSQRQLSSQMQLNVASVNFAIK
ncbi:MAG: winged helix-turn-helix transcriptional regulator, partial [Planctomycetota bacterium]